MRKLLIFGLTFLVLLCSAGFIRADIDKEIEGVTDKLEDQRKQLADLKKRKEQLAKDIASASVSFSRVSAELADAEADLAKIKKNLAAKEKTLKKRKKVRNALVRDFYKRSRVSPFELILSDDDFVTSAKHLFYYQDNMGVMKKNIVSLNEQIAIFKENQKEARELRDGLAALRAQYLAKLAASQKQLSSTSSQLSQVKSSIKNLTAKQERLILEKFAQTSQAETIGDQEPMSVPLPNPGFSPAFAFATYGYPHRVGMNQYGAYGRALAGQNYKTILKAYYANVSVGSYPVPSKISVKGYGKIPFEGKYLKGISEMPRSWPMEALKAQAVAARTYALNYVAANGTICTTQACQVYRNDRTSCADTYDKRWCDAVKATEGIVITYGGAPITAWYASTAGGYTLSAQEVWGGYRAWALGIKDFGPKGAYDGPSYGSSPWYHKAWGSRTGGGYNPWMKEEEVADVFNALLLSKHSDSYNKYLSPIDKGGWSMKRVRDELTELGKKPATSITAVVTTANGKGNTASIYVCGGGYGCSSPLTFSGRDFRAMFNLRSRGTLVLWTNYFDLIRP